MLLSETVLFDMVKRVVTTTEGKTDIDFHDVVM